MVRVFILIHLIIYTNSAFCQTIVGKIETDSAWRQIIYIINASSYNMILGGSDASVIDSVYIDTEGKFIIDNNKIKTNTLYRLNVTRKGDTKGIIINNGINDNYAFTYIGNSDDTIFLTGKINAFFRTYNIENKDINVLVEQNQIVSIRDKYLPYLDEMLKITNKLKDTIFNSKEENSQFLQKAVMGLASEKKKVNELLVPFIDSIYNPEIIAFALRFYGIGEIINDTIIDRTILRLQSFNQLSPLVLTTLEKYNIENLQNLVSKSNLSEVYTLINSDSIRIDTIKSKYTLLHFWASWCLPCREAIKSILIPLDTIFNKEDLTIIGINTDKEKQKALYAINKDKNPFCQIYDSANGVLSELFLVQHLPSYFLIENVTGKIYKMRVAALISGQLTLMLN